MHIKSNVGLIIDDTIVSKQIYDLVILSMKSKKYKISHLIIQHTNKYSGGIFRKSISYIKVRGFSKLLNNFMFLGLQKIEAIFVKRMPPFKRFFDKFDLTDLNLEVIDVYPMVSKSGLVYRYSDTDLAAIASVDLNLLIRGGSGILKGGILEVCPNGVISFHHADNDVNRGGPPGFWEVFRREDRTGFIIQKLKDELDGGDVLYKGYIATSFMYTLNLARLYEKSNPFLHKTIERVVANSVDVKVYDKSPYAFTLCTTPNPLSQISYILSTIGIVAKKLLRLTRTQSHRWSVAYQFVDDWRDIALWRCKRITNPPNRFLADPFLYQKNGIHYCFLEDYDYNIGRGCISVYEIAAEGYKDLGVAIKEDFHLSYPFLLPYQGDLYMCPETHEARDIRLYKCVDFPLKWELSHILIDDISAADSNIFYKDGKWWLLTNVCSSGLHDHSNELHIFSSERLLSTDWTPHPLNPVIFDSDRGRNGGLISDDNYVYRVFQSQGFDMYGKAFGVGRINEISESNYSEETIFRVEPSFFKNLKGTHTYNYCEGLAVLDVVEIENHKL
jgi:hypothetical protein